MPAQNIYAVGQNLKQFPWDLAYLSMQFIVMLNMASCHVSEDWSGCSNYSMKQFVIYGRLSDFYFHLYI